MRPWVLAVTGASGAPYAHALLGELAREGIDLSLVFSPAGRQVFEFETGVCIPQGSPSQAGQGLLARFGGQGRWEIWPHDDLWSPLASGSHQTQGMIICPASMGSVGRIAHGVSQSLVERAADVTLKESRPLILAFRETPLHTGHLENLLTLSRWGARILPLAPPFYQRPEDLSQAIGGMVGKILDTMGLSQTLLPAWKGGPV